MDMKMFLLPKNLFHIVCHPFQIMNNINGSTPSIQNIRNIQKRRATWDDPIEMVNFQHQIQNKIGFSYLGGLNVELI
jgi:hypothetical protein